MLGKLFLTSIYNGLRGLGYRVTRKINKTFSKKNTYILILFNINLLFLLLLLLLFIIIGGNLSNLTTGTVIIN